MPRTPTGRPVGRPKKPDPALAPLDVIEIHDRRRELASRLVALHQFPPSLTSAEVLRRFGIAGHLQVIRVSGEDGAKTVIQEGRR